MAITSEVVEAMRKAAHGARKETWKDIKGRKHRAYTVRSMGPHRGFAVLDSYRNIIVAYPFSTRQGAWDYLNGK